MARVEALDLDHFIGIKLVHTAQIVQQLAARPLNEDGVLHLKASFRNKGIIKITNMSVMLLPGPSGEEKYKLLDGAHRLRALRELQIEDPYSDWVEVEVRVYKDMTEEQQLLLDATVDRRMMTWAM